MGEILVVTKCNGKTESFEALGFGIDYLIFPDGQLVSKRDCIKTALKHNMEVKFISIGGDNAD